MTHNPPSLLELAARVIKTNEIPYTSEILPKNLIDYLNGGRRCVNNNCKGTSFNSFNLLHFQNYILFLFLLSKRCVFQQQSGTRQIRWLLRQISIATVAVSVQQQVYWSSSWRWGNCFRRDDQKSTFRIKLVINKSPQHLTIYNLHCNDRWERKTIQINICILRYIIFIVFFSTWRRVKKLDNKGSAEHIIVICFFIVK